MLCVSLCPPPPTKLAAADSEPIQCTLVQCSCFPFSFVKKQSIVVARMWARMGAHFHPLKSHLYLSVLQTKQTIFVDVVFVVVVALNCIARFTCCHLMYFYVIFLLFCFQYQRFSVSRWNGSQKSNNNNKNCINESKQCEWKWCYKKPQRVSISLKPKQLQCLVNMWINY